jgi:VIT1/CCC1 family predicted Fe2+/Mn2+ transporter
MQADRRAAAELINEVQSESEALSASLGVRTALLETLGASREELQRFADALAERLSHRSGTSRVEELSHAYTAASERSAHDRALARNRTGGHAHDGCAPFGNEAAPLIATLASQPAPALAEGSVELF